MRSCSIYLIESGFAPEPPVFPKDCAASAFPFWGDYRLLDFASANIRKWAFTRLCCLAEPRFRSLGDWLVGRFGPDKIPVLVMEQGLQSLLQVMEQDDSELLLLYPFSQICILDQDPLSCSPDGSGSDLVRLSADNTPLDLYVARRKALIRLLKSAREALTERSAPLASLFTRILERHFEIIENLPGLALHRNSLMQLYQGNLWLAEHLGSSLLEQRIAHLNNGLAPSGEIRIEKGGSVKNCFLSSDTVVEGSVEGSVLFPGVVIGRGAVVQDSVIMNNNWVGARAQVYRSLILPRLSDNPKGQCNIGEESIIGLRQS